MRVLLDTLLKEEKRIGQADLIGCAASVEYGAGRAEPVDSHGDGAGHGGYGVESVGAQGGVLLAI